MRYRPVEEVFSRTTRFVSSQAKDSRQRRILLTAVESLKAQLDGEEVLPFISLPLAVYAAIRGEEEPALPLAVAATLLFMGIDLLDDLADGDLPAAAWRGFSPSEVQLAANTILCALAPEALMDLAAPAETRVALQRRLTRGFVLMSAGQQRDLSHAGVSRVGARAVEKSVIGKSGEETALWTALAALLAGAPSARIKHYEDVGRAVGTAGQLASDCYDLFQAERSRDLENGTRTLPIALHLESLSGPEHRRFLSLLDQARREAAARAEIRRMLIEAGRLRHSAFMVEVYCQKAFAGLERAEPLEPAGEALREMIRKMSFFGKKTPQRKVHENGKIDIVKGDYHESDETEGAHGSLERGCGVPARAESESGSGGQERRDRVGCRGADGPALDGLEPVR